MSDTLVTGLHENISFQDYCAWDAINISLLKHIEKSGEHLQYEKQNAQKDTDSQRLGHASHTALLQPEMFEAFYVDGIPGDGRTKEVKEARKLLEETKGDKVIITPEQKIEAWAIATAVQKHSKARGYIEGAKKELSALCFDPDIEIFCKARIDIYNPDQKLIADVKTAANVQPWGFARQVYDLGYYLQAAYYVRVCKLLGLDVKHFVFIAVENKPPYGVKVYRLTDEVIELGERKNLALLRKYATCLDRNEWPGYSEEVEDIGIPTYGIQTLEEAYGTGPRIY